MIHKADGRIFNEPGGISYSVVGSAILGDGMDVLPIIGLHPQDERCFFELFRHLDNVDVAGVYSTGLRTRRVDLFYEDENNRWECSTQPIEPTTFDRIEPFLPADGIHINLISGNDIDLDTLRRIRNSSADSHIHIDLHNIVMEHLPDSKRVRVARPDYLEWCKAADTVQLNEEEAQVIDSSSPERERLAAKILSGGTKAVVITLAEKGLVLFTKESGEVVEHRFEPRQTEIVDSTGCGDVFGAAFLHGILLGKNFVDATIFGIDAATRKLSSAGPSGLIKKVDLHA